jgi:hypothetical protein
MDNHTTRPAPLGSINTMPSGLHPVGSNTPSAKSESGHPLLKIALWVAMGVVLVLVVRQILR